MFYPMHRSYSLQETIAAVATAPGEGGIAIVRISGNAALDVAAKIFSKDVKKLISHTAYYGKLSSVDGQKIDDVI